MSAVDQSAVDVREDTAVREWAPLAYWIAREYHFPGADRDDVNQEALIGLCVGLRSYDESKGPLKPFLLMCIRRWLIARLQAHQREKHGPLNDSIRNAVNDDGETIDILEVLPGGLDPARIVEGRHNAAEILGRFALLTTRERECLIAVSDGQSYAAIGGSAKAIDNAVQRARRKLRESA